MGGRRRGSSFLIGNEAAERCYARAGLCFLERSAIRLRGDYRLARLSWLRACDL
jgi:hypothetical protein